ncbi:hypothetical protein [Caloranaerobacter ferrireducens]|uniref:hypothetical protein n=1 Tax=Caloranaerobacter ferrireducens TaxID=1323370 RepID=UPI00084CFCC0|nr:hypothetical protein [Caloranaerobacter ferrireducens]
MYQNIKNNIITIISIFISLSVGIYIGYIIDLQSSVLETDEKLINLIEKQILYLESENKLLRKQVLGQNNVDYLAKNIFSNISLKKLINVHITFISYEEEFSYDELFKYIKELEVNNIDVITLKNILIKEISESANLKKMYNNKDVFKVYIKKCLKGLFSNILYNSNNIRSKELSVNDNKKYKNIIVFIKNSESNKIAFVEEITEEVLIQMCKERELPLIIIQKESQDSTKQVFIKK